MVKVVGVLEVAPGQAPKPAVKPDRRHVLHCPHGVCRSSVEPLEEVYAKAVRLLSMPIDNSPKVPK